jgi:hypothetical protein
VVICRVLAESCHDLTAGINQVGYIAHWTTLYFFGTIYYSHVKLLML